MQLRVNNSNEQLTGCRPRAAASKTLQMTAGKPKFKANSKVLRVGNLNGAGVGVASDSSARKFVVVVEKLSIVKLP